MILLGIYCPSEFCVLLIYDVINIRYKFHSDTSNTSWMMGRKIYSQIMRYLSNTFESVFLVRSLWICPVSRYKQWVPDRIVHQVAISALWRPLIFLNKVGRSSIKIFLSGLARMSWSSILLKYPVSIVAVILSPAGFCSSHCSL